MLKKIPKTEYSLPYEVFESVEKYVNSLSDEERGEPFLILRAGWNNTSEVAVKIGTRSHSDSLLFEDTSRHIYQYQLAFAGEARFGKRYVEGTHATYNICLLEKHRLFTITFTQREKGISIKTGFKEIDWCSSNY